MSKERISIIGQRFGKFVVLSKIDCNRYLCICDCGNERICYRSNLTSGKHKSCGCGVDVTKNKSYKHGLSHTKIHNIYLSMKDRCNNKTSKAYKHYGKRGICVCDEWQNDFLAFYNWAIMNGYKEGLSIDRIDVNGNYEPSNCRWITLAEQQNNKTNNTLIEFNKQIKNLTQWAKELGIKKETLITRLYQLKWSVEKSFTTPVRSKKMSKNKTDLAQRILKLAIEITNNTETDVFVNYSGHVDYIGISVYLQGWNREYDEDYKEEIWFKLSNEEQNLKKLEDTIKYLEEVQNNEVNSL